MKTARMTSHFRSAARIGALLVAVFATGCQRFAFLTPYWNSGGQSALARSAASQPVPPPPPKLSAQEQLNGKFALARTVEQSAELERAAAAYKDVLKSDRKHAASHHRLAVVCERQGKSDEAEEHFRLALRQSPNDAELLCDFGYSLYLRGQFAEAESHLRGALKRAPTLARAHNNLGLVLARTGRVAESIPHFESAGGSSAEAHANAAFALMLDERWPEAHEQVMIALEIDPNCAVAGQRLNEVRAVLARTSPNGPGINDGIHASALGPPPQVAALPPAYSAANAAGGYSTR